MWKALHNHMENPVHSSVICDIRDGKKYQESATQGTITLTMNTDGVQLFKSSAVSTWPVWVIINELPMSMKYARKCDVAYMSGTIK